MRGWEKLPFRTEAGWGHYKNGTWEKLKYRREREVDFNQFMQEFPRWASGGRRQKDNCKRSGHTESQPSSIRTWHTSVRGFGVEAGERGAGDAYEMLVMLRRCWWCSGGAGDAEERLGTGTGTGTGTDSLSQARRCQLLPRLLQSCIAAWREPRWLAVVPVKMFHFQKLVLYWYFHVLEYLSSKGCFSVYCSFAFVKFWNVDFFF